MSFIKKITNAFRTNQGSNNNRRPYNRKSNQSNRGSNNIRHAPAGNKKENYFLYVLSLSNGGMYVGITNNPERRFKEHSSGQGSKVTHTYPPTGVITCYSLGYMTYAQAEKFEDDKTLELMEINGYSCIRGGHWSMVNDKAIYYALVNNKARIAKDFGRQVDLMVCPR